MKNLRECLKEAVAGGFAIGHFNTSGGEVLKAIVNAGRENNSPVIIGTSEGEANFIGKKQAVAVVRSLREEYDWPIFLNGDHMRSFESFKEAVDAGYDSVMFDGSALPFEENIKETKRCVQYAKKQNREVLVEGEIGFIGQSSEMLNDLPPGVKIGPEFYTKPEEAKRFVEETGVDLLAPFIGNIHGMFKEAAKEPGLDTERVGEIKKETAAFLVLHGGSGNAADEVKKAIAQGISIVHVNTEIRVVYKQALRKSLESDSEETAPYKYFKESLHAVTKLVGEKIKIFNNKQ